MAARVWVTVKRNQFPQIAKDLPITAENIINGHRGPQMKDIARQRSRVDTGEMRDGWLWRRTSHGSGVLENAVPHTLFNEYGTIHMSAQPMARPAKEEVWPLILDDFRKALARAAA